MKSLLACIILLGIISPSFSQTAENDFKRLEWLTGTWNRTNITKPGRTAHERWEKSDTYALRGYGVNMQGQDTVFLEKISIVIKDNALYYVADVPENKQPIYFKFTAITNTGFVCENPQHDFPKKITYELEGEKLKAQISGNGKAMDYIFERKE
jgi:hypothetical protein